MSSNPIIDTFMKYFFVIRARSPEQCDAAYNIRYQVYCQEFGYEPETKFSDKKECDEYDPQSHHCLIIHKITNVPAGCVRLIVADKGGSNLLLPFERFCAHALNPNLIDVSKLDRYGISEISRLAVTARFRRRKTDEKKPISLPEEETVGGQRLSSFPIIPVSLVLSVLAVILSDGYEYGFCMMEPRLARMLGRYSLIFDPIGEVIDYHGFRGPFLIYRDSILRNLKPDVAELMNIISQQLAHFNNWLPEPEKSPL